MRRAVTDQINALKELSEIVSRSGRPFGNGEPRQARQAPAAPQPAPRPAPQGAQQATVMERPAAQPAARPQPRQQQSAGAQAPRPQQARPAAAQPAPARAAQAPQEGGGWVKDLLRRASEDDQPAPAQAPARAAPQRSPLHVVESLNSLSVDIARAIDHEASVELWDRYRRGERNVFTRRLYTLKGQQTFDDIRRKYQTETEFRNAVDTYCDDFERLLADVTRNDRDGMMSQTYLTSDTGKVYTMLAHASGRLK